MSQLHQCIANKIKELHKVIQVIKLLQMNKLKNIQLSDDLKLELRILHQINHKVEDLDINNIVTKINIEKPAENKD